MVALPLCILHTATHKAVKEAKHTVGYAALGEEPFAEPDSKLACDQLCRLHGTVPAAYRGFYVSQP